MKKLLIALILTLSLSSTLLAGGKSFPDEGMWLPMFVERLNYTDMKSMGLRLTAEELYSINNSSLKDAIVSLDFFCTAEVISSQGLMLTNHHCVYDLIQKHSSIELDYLTHGFWAQNLEEELSNPGLSAWFLERMEDVTSTVLEGIEDGMTEDERNAIINKAIKKLEKDNSEKGRYEVNLKSFFNGNEYYMFIYTKYNDVRLVGAPPSGVGKFGGDTDNWMWPRHTGDFSLLRVYTDEDGMPAEYNKSNIPLVPKHHLPISTKGIQKNDFTMIWGYPGTTDRYLTSFGVKQAIEKSNPATVKIRDKKLAIWREFMANDDVIRIMYASNYAQVANYWKYFQGQTRGLKRLKVYDKKLETEMMFTFWTEENANRREMYSQAIPLIRKSYEKMEGIVIPKTYIEEGVFQGPEVFMRCFSFLGLYNLAQNYSNDKKKYQAAIDKQVESLKGSVDDLFKDYYAPMDQLVFAALMEMYHRDVDTAYHPMLVDVKRDKKGDVTRETRTMLFDVVFKKYKGSFDEWAKAVYAESIFTDKARMEAFLNKPNNKRLLNDPLMLLTMGFITSIREVYGQIGEIDEDLSKGNRLFLAGLREMKPNQKFYPDANSSLRMTYGKVMDYFAADAVYYSYFTTAEGILEKEDPTNDEFILPDKLKQLLKNRDYGRWADDKGRLVICFVSDNDITGGNSGSPVLNANGELIGCAFDGNWEAMSGDIAFEPDLQRTINVDIRYVLFIIDKYAGANHLIEEMTLVE